MELIKSETALKQLDQMFAFTEQEADATSELRRKIATVRERIPTETVDDVVATMRPRFGIIFISWLENSNRSTMPCTFMACYPKGDL